MYLIYEDVPVPFYQLTISLYGRRTKWKIESQLKIQFRKIWENKTYLKKKFLMLIFALEKLNKIEESKINCSKMNKIILIQLINKNHLKY